MVESRNMKRPYFIWDYNLNDKKIKKILQSGNNVEKQWLIARILSHAKYEDVWKYLTVDDIIAYFPKLKLNTLIKNAWKKALTVWGYHV